MFNCFCFGTDNEDDYNGNYDAYFYINVDELDDDEIRQWSFQYHQYSTDFALVMKTNVITITIMMIAFI